VAVEFERESNKSRPFVGRQHELVDIATRVARAGSGETNVLLIRGEPGIGKTRLIRAAQSAAVSDGFMVSSVTGVEAEGAIALAALATLVGQPDGITETPELRAILRGERASSALALGMALLNALAETSSNQRTLLVLDDAQWIDDPSCEALVFALRRLTHESLMVLVGIRSGEPCGFDGAGFDETTITAMASSELYDLASDTADAVIERCCEWSSGNPMAFIELMDALNAAQRAGREPIDGVVWESRKLADWIGSRIGHVSHDSLVGLSVVAAAGTDSARPIHAALGLLGRTVDDLLECESAGLIEIRPGTVRLVHPLYRTAIAATVGADGMRRAHRAIAQAYGEDVEASWHWAAAAVGPDEEAAAGLERLAERSISWGAPSMAAEAYDRAAQLSADDAQHFRRRLLAGQFWWEAADAPRAIEHLSSTLDDAVTASDRADVAGVLGDAIGWRRSVREGVELQQDAARAVKDIDAGRAAFLELRGVLLLGLAGDCEGAYEAAERAVEFALADGGLTVIATHAVRALAAQMVAKTEIAENDLALILPFTDLPPESHTVESQLFLQVVSYALMLREEHDRVESILGGVLISARQMGLEGVIGFTGGLISEVAFRRGRFVDAVFLAQPDVNLHQRLDTGAASPGQAALTRACAALGRFEEAFEYGKHAIGNARAPGMKGLEAWAEAGLGLAYLGQGDVDRAVHTLTRVARLANRYLEPSFMWFESDLADAFLQAGKTHEALNLATSLDARCAMSGTRYGTAVAHRIRGIVLESRSEIEDSLTTFRSLDASFEEARSMLALAEHFGDDTAGLAAANIFERLAAAPWADRAWRSTRKSASTPQPDRALSSLSAAELRVAACVARGRSNKEAASELSLSARTVDAHLQSIYRKLNIKRRTELALLFTANHS
jgi:DNA-binding CsgD family transcriptional regulator